MPLIFVNDLRLTDEDGLEALFRCLPISASSPTLPPPTPAPGLGDVALPGVPIDLVRAPTRADGDVHEVHALSVAGASHGGGIRPALQSVDVALPALRVCRHPTWRTFGERVKFTERYLDRGAAEDVTLEIVGEKIDVDFRAHADRAGGRRRVSLPLGSRGSSARSRSRVSSQARRACSTP